MLCIWQKKYGDIECREDTYEGLMNMLHTASAYVVLGLEQFADSRASEWPVERRNLN